LDGEIDQYQASERQPQSESEGEGGPDLNLFEQESSEGEQDNDLRTNPFDEEVQQDKVEQPLIDFGTQP